MFAKRARFHGISRRQTTVPKAMHCNDNQPIRRVVTLSSRRRPVLVCHWHQSPAGALECSWHIKEGDAALAEEPAMRRLTGRGRTRSAAALMLL
jgi:hypothetical protein